MDDRGLINDITYCAYKFDDKPHHLFSAIMNLVNASDMDPHIKAEANRLMDACYHKAGRILGCVVPREKEGEVVVQETDLKELSEEVGLRDYIATQALIGLLVSKHGSIYTTVGECAHLIGLPSYRDYDHKKHSPLVTAKQAYLYADAMLEARK